MCIAIAKPAGVHINRAVLKECFDRNGDGAGFMYCNGQGGVEIRKPYFKFRDFYQAYRSAEAAHPESPFGLHFRIATSGELDKDNSHPHRISSSMAMIHNGILSLVVPKDSPLSDTVLFTQGVLQQLPSNFDEFSGITWLIERYLGHNNKIVVLKGSGEFVILNEKAGHWHEGAWFSNYSYRVYVKAVDNSKGNSYSSDFSHRGVDRSRDWCRLCLTDLEGDERLPNCTMCKEIAKLKDEAENFPHYMKKHREEFMERVSAVSVLAGRKIEHLLGKQFGITAGRVRHELEAMVKAVGKVLPLAMGPGDVGVVEVAKVNATSGPALPSGDGSASGSDDSDTDIEGGVIIGPEQDTEALWRAFMEGEEKGGAAF